MLFRTLLFSSSTAFVQSRRTIFALHYLSYVKFILRHSLSYDKLHHKNRRPERKIGAAVLSCKASQIFFHILILRKASIMSPMCSGCGGMRPSRIAPRQEKDTTKVVSFSQPVEEPCLHSGADWVSNIYERKNVSVKCSGICLRCCIFACYP